MGYRVDTTAVLVLEAYDGAEVEVLIGVPIGVLMAYDLADDLAGEWAVFAEHALRSWNLSDAKGDISLDTPHTRLPLPLVRLILTSWRRAAVQPPAPLSPPSDAGEPSDSPADPSPQP